MHVAVGQHASVIQHRSKVTQPLAEAAPLKAKQAEEWEMGYDNPPLEAPDAAELAEKHHIIGLESSHRMTDRTWRMASKQMC
jgi:hypothetical protein